MKKSAVVRFVGNQNEYRLGCEASAYSYCRDCNQCAGTDFFLFTEGTKYNAYFLEYWQRKRTSLHVKGENGEISDFVPLEDFEIVSDEDSVLSDLEAIVRCVTHRYCDEPFGLHYGKEYKATGFGKTDRFS